jgi:hypothetical protein
VTKKLRLEYKIVGAPDLRTIEDQVNQLTADGWQPVGGIAVLGGRLCQALTRRTSATRAAVDNKPKEPARCEREWSAADGRKRCRLPAGHEGEHHMVRIRLT